MNRVQRKTDPQKAKMSISSARAKRQGKPIHDTTLKDLPLDCITSILSLTTPLDVCRLSIVSKAFLSASKSVAWNRFLPSDLNQIVARSDGGEAWLSEFRNKNKQLFMRLADWPLLLDHASKSFWLEKLSGKKCWLFGARSLSITWIDDRRYWKWTSRSYSRFPEVAKIRSICWLEISLKIQSSTLSPGTQYAAYLVFKIRDKNCGFEDVAETLVITPESGQTERNVYLKTSSIIDGIVDIKADQLPRCRDDLWQESKIGEFFTPVKEDEDHTVEFIWRLLTIKWKRGLIVEGIELRPVSLLKGLS